MTAVNVGILGLGTVATGTVKVLQRNADDIARRAGRRIHLQQIAVRDVNKRREAKLDGVDVVSDAFAVVNNPDIDVVIELIGGEEPAKALILQAISNKKHVVTANKALIAKYGNELFAAAQQQGVMIAFEGAVAGGIPIIKAIREGLAGNCILSVVGIINGTCNYILSLMKSQSCDFEMALANAQQLGYAEADPSFDIDGVDAAHKLTILASIAFGIPLQFDRVSTEGICGITQQDIRYAQQLGYCIKHLGIAKQTAAGIELRVHPTMISQQHTLAHVNGVLNALLVEGDAVGSTLYSGAGAGSEPTASAVVADLVDVVRTLTVDPQNRVPHLAFQADSLQDIPIVANDDIHVVCYLRMMAADRPGVLAQITHILGDLEISIESILQKEREQQEGYIPIVIVSQQVKESLMNQAIQHIEALEGIRGKVTRIRIESLP